MTNPIQLARGAISLARLVRDPNRLDEVFKLANTGDVEPIMRIIATSIRRDEAGARALAARARLEPYDLHELAQLDEGTLGRAFADHMLRNGLDPASIPRLESASEPAFVRAHLYETHDIWHVATGFATDVAGELGLQAVYLAQLPGLLPLLILSGGLLNTALYRPQERDERMRQIVRGWLLGKGARPLFGVRWDAMWQRPLADIRTELGLDLAQVERMLPT
jgi:ubiquinone biosynthesis protein Coq4